MAHQAGAYPGFSSMKRLGVFLLPPEWDASPSQGYPKHQIRRYPFIHLGGERHCEVEVSCPRTQHNVPGQGSNPEPRSGVERTNHEATAPPLNKTSVNDRPFDIKNGKLSSSSSVPVRAVNKQIRPYTGIILPSFR